MNAKENGAYLKKAHHTVLRNSTLLSNGSLGVQVSASDAVQVRNNLVYANGNKELERGGGIQVGGENGAGSTGAIVESNTVYGNGVNGILIGTAADPSPHAQVRYNIIGGNGGNGLQLNNAASSGASAAGLCVEFNVNSDPYGPMRADYCSLCLDADAGTSACSAPPCVKTIAGCILQPPGDVRVDAQMVRPSGRDGCLGGRHFRDDDFRLLPTSPGVDFSNQSAATAGLSDRTTQSDDSLDTGMLDAGFHYLPIAFAPGPGAAGDCDANGCVTVNELVLGVNIALERSDIGDCRAFDLDGDGSVRVDELVMAVQDAFCCAR
jgi:hypothetical protein